MSSQNICFLAEIRKNVNLATPYLELGPVVQSIVSLISLLVTNMLTVIAKVFSNTLIAIKATYIFFSKKYQFICHISR